jgi:hypothetical protein
MGSSNKGPCPLQIIDYFIISYYNLLILLCLIQYVAILLHFRPLGEYDVTIGPPIAPTMSLIKKCLHFVFSYFSGFLVATIKSKDIFT